MSEPLEIKPEDIIRRPTGLDTAKVTTGGKGNNPLEEIKGYVEQGKELLKLAEDLGLPVDKWKSLIPGLAGKNPSPQPDNLAPQANQVLLVQKMLIMAYGDITVNELIEKLKEDYGGKKLSSIKLK